MNPEKQKIIDKVTKLLALSENNSNTPEAEAARNKAASLMAQYDISIIQAQEKPQFDVLENVLTRIKPIKYDSVLIRIVASFNQVEYLIQHGSYGDRGKNIFIGRQQDIESLNYMLAVLFQQRKVSWKKHLSEFKQIHNRPPKEKEKVAWMMGFAFGIRSKLDNIVEIKEARIEEKGLVPLNLKDQALAEYEKNHGGVRTSKGKPISYSRDGYDAGKAAHINKGVETQNGVKQIS